MPRVRRLSQLAALPAVALLLAACGGDSATGPKNPGARGTFAATVSGHVSRPLAGVAFYGHSATDGFAVGMGVPGTAQGSYRDLVVIARERAGLPTPGTYPLYNSASDADATAEQFLLAASFTLPSGGDLLCAATTGTVTFQAASGGRLIGSYTTQASCVDAANPTAELRVTLAGSFEAVESTSVPSTQRAGGAALPTLLRAGRVSATPVGR